jgi:hypothetical protein
VETSLVIDERENPDRYRAGYALFWLGDPWLRKGRVALFTQKGGFSSLF